MPIFINPANNCVYTIFVHLAVLLTHKNKKEFFNFNQTDYVDHDVITSRHSFFCCDQWLQNFDYRLFLSEQFGCCSPHFFRFWYNQISLLTIFFFNCLILYSDISAFFAFVCPTIGLNTVGHVR